MIELTINQIQDRKRDTEQQITDLLIKFFEETGLLLVDLDVITHPTPMTVGKESVVWVEMRLEIP